MWLLVVASVTRAAARARTAEVSAVVKRTVPFLIASLLCIMDAQRQVRQEAQEKQEVLQDLLRWAPETQKRPGGESAVSIRPAGPVVPGTQEGIAPVRTRRAAGNQATASFPPNTLQQSTTVSAQASNGSAAGHTYDKFSSKWDKFDYDSALAEADNENGIGKQPFSFPKASKLSGAPSG